MDFRQVRLRNSSGPDRDWRGRKVVVIGLARQGKALARYFSQKGARVVISDIQPAEALLEARQELSDFPIEYVFGDHPPALLEHAHLLCLSGGVPADLPLAKQAQDQGIPLSNDSQLFLEVCPAPVIGITGSAGKTTVTTLVGRMIAAQFQGSERRVWVGGNIGRPLLASMDDINSDDLVVMELSSFQLELMTQSPQVAAVLNVTPNHLDRHRTMEAYTAAKARILNFQTETDLAILGFEDGGAWDLRTAVQGQLIGFGRKLPNDVDGAYLDQDTIWLRIEGNRTSICPVSSIELRGEHNLLNVLAACAVAGVVGISSEKIAEGVSGFRGVEHRLEFVRQVGGADWYNDSIATSPERAIAAIQSFEEPLVLLAGGRDKDLPWESFAELVRERVDHLVLFGEAGEKIARAIDVARVRTRPQSIHQCAGLAEAVTTAAEIAEAGDVVLLAPGGTSFDEFKDFAERGERFRQLVDEL